MATAKFTVQRGRTSLKDVAVTAGSAEAQSDTMSLNIDYTKLTKGDARILLDAIRDKLFAGKWPPIA